MPKTSTSNNIENIKFKVQTYDKGEPDTGFAQVGVDPASGVYRVDDAEVIHYLEHLSGSGGGAEELIDLTDVSAAAQTANFVLAAGDGATGGDYRGRLLVAADIPQLQATKMDVIGVKATTGTAIVIDTELVEHDVNFNTTEFDTNSFITGTDEITIPTGLGGYYDITIDLNITTIDSSTTPLSFSVNYYVDTINLDTYTIDSSWLNPQRVTWRFVTVLTQTDIVEFKVLKTGGTALQDDEVVVTITLIYMGKQT